MGFVKMIPPKEITPLPLPEGMDKKGLRARVRASVLGAEPSVLAAASGRIMEALEAMDEFAAARTVALYWALPGEVDTRPLIGRHPEKRLLLPVMQGEDLLLKPFAGEERLVRHPWGVWEPDSGEAVPLSEVDLMVLPGAAFDPGGGRLGYGKGFYDRLLSGASGPARFLTVGVCFDFQLYERVPRQAHDRTVDRVIAGSEEKITIFALH